ncbi:PAXNEB-domain-containing protein [Marasmius fiardii PR-910]|nr:PAXNEB-domain-containing protein [Marasmius fiardii PR-910]
MFLALPSALMSSFKRKTTAKQTETLPGTRPSPGSVGTLLTSTGIPSLDDILGGGLPLSCSLLVTAPDPHSSYGELVQKYFVAQGFVSTQEILLIDENPLEFAKGCMWVSKSNSGEDEEERSDEKIKIAWRYENMKQFQTTIGHSIPYMENFCGTFDLTARISESVIQKAVASKQLKTCDHFLVSRGKAKPLRICIPALGSPGWGDFSPENLLYFLQRIRILVRRHTNACISISLPPHLSTERWGGRGWIDKIGWFMDALVSLEAFTANPSMISLFPSHHGLVRIHTLPASSTFLPPSDRFSVLRGLSAAAAESSGSGENNLGFKCTRKRFVIETMHLDLEGGVSERRTTPNSTGAESVGARPSDSENCERVLKAGMAGVAVELEETNVLAEEASSGTAPASWKDSAQGQMTTEMGVPSQSKIKKPKKKVGFRTDRPDVYDF